jgi:hypothetical protein
LNAELTDSELRLIDRRSAHRLGAQDCPEQVSLRQEAQALSAGYRITMELRLALSRSELVGGKNTPVMVIGTPAIFMLQFTSIWITLIVFTPR